MEEQKKSGKWSSIAKVGGGFLSGAASVIAIMQFVTPQLSEDRWINKLKPLDNGSEEVQFLFAEWCCSIEGVKTTFRKGPDKSIERGFVAPANPFADMKAIDTGFEPIELYSYTRPDRTWMLVQMNEDESQTHYVRLSNQMMTENRTDLPGDGTRMWRCDAKMY